ncbi:hypothetical protein [Streptomyces wuyuanensis]|uniref:hypothetical protein n=1 Tax=Streptomyces wuyuanensis TaxID=1196353 RepID=UPI003D724038
MGKTASSTPLTQERVDRAGDSSSPTGGMMSTWTKTVPIGEAVGLVEHVVGTGSRPAVARWVADRRSVGPAPTADRIGRRERLDPVHVASGINDRTETSDQPTSRSLTGRSMKRALGVLRVRGRS